MISANRTSHTLSPTAVRNMIDAAEYAYWSNHPLNRFVTIHLEKAGVHLTAHAFITKLTKQIGDWLRVSKMPPCYLWVLENHSPTGLHVHLLFHVPRDRQREFSNRLRTWIKHAGGKRRPGVLNSKPIGRKPDEPSGGRYIAALEGLLKYLLKGSDPRLCHDLGIRHTPQGVVRGKRCAVSESLGQKARAKWRGLQAARFSYRGHTLTPWVAPTLLFLTEGNR